MTVETDRDSLSLGLLVNGVQLVTEQRATIAALTDSESRMVHSGGELLGKLYPAPEDSDDLARTMRFARQTIASAAAEGTSLNDSLRARTTDSVLRTWVLAEQVRVTASGISDGLQLFEPSISLVSIPADLLTVVGTTTTPDALELDAPIRELLGQAEQVAAASLDVLREREPELFDTADRLEAEGGGMEFATALAVARWQRESAAGRARLRKEVASKDLRGESPEAAFAKVVSSIVEDCESLKEAASSRPARDFSPGEQVFFKGKLESGTDLWNRLHEVPKWNTGFVADLFVKAAVQKDADRPVTFVDGQDRASALLEIFEAELVGTAPHRAAAVEGRLPSAVCRDYWDRRLFEVEPADALRQAVSHAAALASEASGTGSPARPRAGVIPVAHTTQPASQARTR